MNGRFFAGRQIEANIYDGSTRYKSSAKKAKMPSGGDAEQQQRLEKYSEWIEAE